MFLEIIDIIRMDTANWKLRMALIGSYSIQRSHHQSLFPASRDCENVHAGPGLRFG